MRPNMLNQTHRPDHQPFHFLGEPSRGPTFEVANLLYSQGKVLVGEYDQRTSISHLSSTTTRAAEGSTDRPGDAET